MILADTSVWIDHFRGSESRLRALLERGLVVMHPFVAGELAMGSLNRRADILTLLNKLPEATQAADSEVRELIEIESLFGRGLGCVDAHLLASARLTDDARLWTFDRRLNEAALSLSVAALDLGNRIA